jgi:trans-aconitate 2-methyltransferase
VSGRTRDWDAATYDRVSRDVQVEWAREVLERLELCGDETVLDAGCGSGRVTAMLLERLPRGHVVAVDGAPSMVERAREALGERATVILSDLLELELDEPVDACFSNAVFHWVPDHERLYRRLAAALKPGAQLIAQYGGEGNVARFTRVANGVLAREPYASRSRPLAGAWNFSGPEYARTAATAAGFTDVEAWLEDRPMRPAEPLAFIRSVCLGPYLEHLDADLHERFVGDVARELGDPIEIDYVRLNVSARKEPR